MVQVYLGQRFKHDEAIEHFHEIERSAWAQGFIIKWIEGELAVWKLLSDCWDSPDIPLIAELVESPKSKIEWLREDLIYDEDWNDFDVSEFKTSSREEAEAPYPTPANKYIPSALIDGKYLVSARTVLKLLAKAS